MKKTLFVFRIQSKSDVITNSSSELFVFDDKNTTEDVEQLLDILYPDWKSEYDSPVYVKDMSDEDFIDYLSWVESSISPSDYKYFGYSGSYNAKSDELLPLYVKHLQEYLDDHNFNITPEECFEDFEQVRYELFSYDEQDEYRKTHNGEYPWADVRFSKKFLDMLREAHSNEIALYSLGENPDWDQQEKLMDVATRYHLG